MYARGDFHESYYEHACSIIPEKDILETDIKGSSWLVSFKRWWFNLFLLSYTNKQSRVYYNSSHAMKVERARHFRRHRSCIHPLSKFRNFWDFLILHVMLLNKIIFYHCTSVISCQLPLAIYMIGMIFEIIVIFDIYINSKCGYIDIQTKRVIIDIQKALYKYCSTKLFLHVASAMPLEVLMFVKYGTNIGCYLCKSNTLVCALRFLDAIRLLRIYELSSYWTRDRHTFMTTFLFRTFRICVLGFMTLLQYLTISDTIQLLYVMKTGKIIGSSYFHEVLAHKWAGLTTDISLFCFDFTRTLRSLLLFNFGYSMKLAFLDSGSSLIIYIMTHFFYIWGVVEVFAFFSQNVYPLDRINFNEEATLNLAKCRQLPDELCAKIRRFFDFNMTRARILKKQNGLYKSLPLILKREIALHCLSRKVMRVPYFSQWPHRVIESLVFLLNEEIYMAGDIVAETGVQGDGLVIVDVGVMAVYTDSHTEVGHLIDGDYFGELSLVTDKELRMSYVVAVTRCKVLILEKGAFRKFMRDHPKLFFELKQMLRLKFTSRNKKMESTSSSTANKN